MRRWMIGFGLGALCAALPAAAQKAADKDIDGHLYCYTDGVDLRERGDGAYKVDLVFEYRGDIAHAAYPRGGAKLFGEQGELVSYVSINYDFTVGADAMPRSRPAPVRLAFSTGRFGVPPPQPTNSMTLQLKGGDAVSPAFTISDSAMNIAVASVDIGPTGSESPYDNEISQSALDTLIDGFENSGDRALILSQNGGEIARIPVPTRDILPERDKMIAWIRAAMPLLVKGRCPA